MNINFIKKLVALVEEREVEEVEIRRFWTSIRIRKNSSGRVETIERSPRKRTKEVVEKKVEETEVASVDENKAAVTTPMVGTFFRAPAPDAPPYVEIGDRIRKGQIICIVEAMKIMNEIESEVNGIVTDILVKNEDPVEYNQELFLIKSE
jgi:acetyl-CoA carboxylase biotin carboxyl carrier protein